MSIDPANSTKLMTNPAAPAIENELPTYRAISPMAVASLLFGIASLLCFADLWFLIAAALAMVTGLLALRKLKSYGDVLTGSNLAKAGIILAFTFALSSLTVEGVQLVLRDRGAKDFAADYLKRLNSGKTNDALWYRLTPRERRGVSPGEFATQLKKSKEPGPYQEFMGTIERITGAVVGPPRKKVEFVEVASSQIDKTTNVAGLVYRVVGPDASGKAEETLIMAEIRAEDSPKRENWFVANIIYPYNSKNYNPKAKQEAEEKAHGHLH